MPKTVQKGDFIEIHYTGALKDSGMVFDTTNEAEAKHHDLYQEGMHYGPVIVCVGEGHLLKGLDQEIQGKEIGKDYTLSLSTVEAFGKKNPKLIQLIATQKFMKQQIRPMPGLQVNVDGMVGMIKTVTGGRTLVDFNHPLAGKDVIYTVEIVRAVEENPEKVKAVLKTEFHLEPAITMEGETATVLMVKELPQKIQELIKDRVLKLTKVPVAFKTVDSRNEDSNVHSNKKEQKGLNISNTESTT